MGRGVTSLRSLAQRLVVGLHQARGRRRSQRFGRRRPPRLRIVAVLENVLVGVDLKVVRFGMVGSILCKGVLGSVPEHVFWFHISRLAWRGSRHLGRRRSATCWLRWSCPNDWPAPRNADKEPRAEFQSFGQKRGSQTVPETHRASPARPRRNKGMAGFQAPAGNPGVSRLRGRALRAWRPRLPLHLLVKHVPGWLQGSCAAPARQVGRQGRN